MHSSAKSDEDLLRECAADPSSDAWEEFIRRFHRTIALAVIRTAIQYGKNDAQTIDELVQETLLKLCADERSILKKFDVRHANAVGGFLKVVATNVTHDHLRSQAAAKRGGNRVEQLELEAEAPAADSAKAFGENIDRMVLVTQLHTQLDELLAGDQFSRDRLIFKLYFGQGLTADAISRLPDIGLSAKGVEAALLRMVKLLRQKINRRPVGLR